VSTGNAFDVVRAEHLIDLRLSFRTLLVSKIGRGRLSRPPLGYADRQ